MKRKSQGEYFYALSGRSETDGTGKQPKQGGNGKRNREMTLMRPLSFF
jgi:hypothetical protein